MSLDTDARLPKGWMAVTLADITSPRSGKTNPASVPQFPFIGMEQVEAHTMRLIGTVPSSSMRSGANSFKPYDVLYGRLRAYLNKVYQPDFEGLCSGEFIVLPESNLIHGRFLKYRLNANDFVNFARRINTGDRPRVDWDQIKLFKILLPPHSEQVRISDKLDEILSDLDAGVNALKSVHSKLKQFRVSILKAAVGGELTSAWRKHHPNVKSAKALLGEILENRRLQWELDRRASFEKAGKCPPNGWKKKYVEPIKPTAIPYDLPAGNNGWIWVRLGQLLHSIEAGKSFECVPRPATPDEWGVIKVSAMTWGEFDETEQKAVPAGRSVDPYFEIKTGDLLLSRANTYEHVGATVLVGKCRSKLLLSDKSMRLLHSSLVDKPWLKSALTSPIARKQLSSKSTGTKEGMRNVSQDSVQDILIPLPPREEQSLISDLIKSHFDAADQLQNYVDNCLLKLSALRQSVYHEAFSGNLVPQSPSDESVATILTRSASKSDLSVTPVSRTKIPKSKTCSVRRAGR